MVMLRVNSKQFPCLLRHFWIAPDQVQFGTFVKDKTAPLPSSDHAQDWRNFGPDQNQRNWVDMTAPSARPDFSMIMRALSILQDTIMPFVTNCHYMIIMMVFFQKIFYQHASGFEPRSSQDWCSTCFTVKRANHSATVICYEKMENLL